MATANPKNSIPADLQKELKQAFGLVPAFAYATTPEALRLWWGEMRDFQLNDKTALSGKVKELIGIAVAAQIPCEYCILFHTEAARLNGASEQEIQEAIFMAGVTRQGSTILNGAQLDYAVFSRELKQIVAHIQKQAGQLVHA